MTVKEQLEALRLEKETLELEDLRNKVMADRARKEARRRAEDQQERDINESMRLEKLRQDICNHRKGGKDLEGITNGNDSNFAVIKHQLPTMETIVMCTRCCRVWDRKDPAYSLAMQFPTDNQPSGSSLFANTYKKA